MTWCLSHYSNKLSELENIMTVFEPFIKTLSSKMINEYDEIVKLKQSSWNTIDNQQKKLLALQAQLKKFIKK